MFAGGGEDITEIKILEIEGWKSSDSTLAGCRKGKTLRRCHKKSWWCKTIKKKAQLVWKSKAKQHWKLIRMEKWLRESRTAAQSAGSSKILAIRTEVGCRDNACLWIPSSHAQPGCGDNACLWIPSTHAEVGCGDNACLYSQHRDVEIRGSWGPTCHLAGLVNQQVPGQSITDLSQNSGRDE